MTGTVAAIDFLRSSVQTDVQSVNVVFGDEPYLKLRVVKQLIEANLSGDDAQFGLSRVRSTKVEWRDIVDDLSTISLFGDGRRMVIIEDADDFISQFRVEIEDYVKKPTTDGVLVFSVTRWPSNTRLYKQVKKSGLQVDCRRPQEPQVTSWLQSEASSRFDLSLSRDCAGQMIEIVGCEMGVLDQELTKLALVADSKAAITPDQIREMVGGWRAKTAWDMLDAACDGNVPEATRQLERLINAGEHPVAILGKIAASLRRFAKAARIYRDAERQGRRMRLRAALEAAGFKTYFVNNAERRLKRMGRDRAGDLYRWLLHADLAMKGSSSEADRARLVLEQLIVQIAVPSDAVAHRSPPAPSLARLG